MTIFDQSGNYRNSATLSDGAVISASGVNLTNTVGSKILGGGVIFAEEGSTFVNEFGAEIGERQSMPFYPNVLVQGSNGDDAVTNGGFIFGTVSLGDGNDTFVDRNGLVQGTGWGIYLEGGNDILRIEGADVGIEAIWANGGDGYDTVVVASDGGDPRDSALSGFERLILESGGNIARYSGFETVILASNQPFAFYNFLDSINPDADLFLPDGQTLSMVRSQFHSITGSDGDNTLQLWSSGIFSQASQVLNSVQLGGGNDSFTINAFYGGINPTIGGLIDGGEGQDSFDLIVSDDNGGGAINLDLTSVIDFEELYINAQYTYLYSNVTLSNLVGFQTIFSGEKTDLTLLSAELPGAELRGAAGGSVTLGSDVVIESYNAFRFDPTAGSPAETEADISSSVTFVNNGTVASSIRFAGGFDFYDGRQGGVGGLVDGGAGDDRLLGGFGSEHFLGGAGDDVLDGGRGADVLNGGSGNDYLYGGGDGDVLAGDEGFDYALYTYAPTGVVADLQFASQNSGEAAGDSYVSIEGLCGSSFEDNLRGDQNDNWIWGNGGADYLFGRDGNDVLVGSDDSDTLFGENGSDTLYGNDGNDYLYGGAGADGLNGGNGLDYALYSFSSDSIIADLQFGLQNSGEAKDDVYTGIEGLVGSTFSDSLRGDAGDNYLWGGGGDDALYGRDGNDVLIGGTGNDTLVGGTGSDWFFFAAGDGRDTIYDMQAGNGEGDIIQLSTALGVNSYASVQAHASQIGADTVITFDDHTSLTILNTQQWSLAVDDFVFI